MVGGALRVMTIGDDEVHSDQLSLSIRAIRVAEIELEHIKTTQLRQRVNRSWLRSEERGHVQLSARRLCVKEVTCCIRQGLPSDGCRQTVSF